MTIHNTPEHLDSEIRCGCMHHAYYHIAPKGKPHSCMFVDCTCIHYETENLEWLRKNRG